MVGKVDLINCIASVCDKKKIMRADADAALVAPT